jgi:microcystin-dependent protein
MCIDCNENSDSLPIGPQGPAGEDGTNGTNGTDGQPGVGFTIDVRDESPGSNCPCGGYKIQIGIDINADGVPDALLQEKYICNGCDGENALAPLGGIIEFNGDVTTPGPNFDATGLGINNLLGWALCNGANSTMDLRGKTTITYYAGGDSDGDYGTVGATGGEKKHALIINELAAHTHGPGNLTTDTEPAHFHTIPWGNDAGNGSLVDGTNANPTTHQPSDSAGAHNHVITSGVTGSTGSGVAHENRPPYKVVPKIQRVS